MYCEPYRLLFSLMSLAPPPPPTSSDGSCRRHHHVRAQNATVSCSSDARHPRATHEPQWAPINHCFVCCAHTHTHEIYIRPPLHYPYRVYGGVHIYVYRLPRGPECNAKLSACVFVFFVVVVDARTPGKTGAARNSSLLSPSERLTLGERSKVRFTLVRFPAAFRVQYVKYNMQ